MCTLFYSNISEISGKLQGMLDEGKYKTSIPNMHNIGLKKNHFNSAYVSMLGPGCVFSQYPQFYDKI